jgi:hypothetical protein
MKIKLITIGTLGSGFLASFVPTAFAVEGALGRPISGATIMPYAGVVPPLPGFAVGVGETYYDGSIRGSSTVPVGQNLTLGIDLKASFTPITALYIWDTGTTNWNFASAFSLPIAWLEADANIAVGPRTGHVKDSTFGLFDLAFVPVSASYHLSPTEHLALNFTIWAPSGEYDPNRLANLSMNTWTFIPGVAYTKLFPKADIELSGSWAMTFDTENNATGYQNGILSDLELIAVKRFKCGAGVGVIGSWIDQITNDEGSTADALNGFRGRAFGIGPALTYSTHVGKSHLDFNARWVHEFENKNYVEGNMFMLNATLKF